MLQATFLPSLSTTRITAPSPSPTPAPAPTPAPSSSPSTLIATLSKLWPGVAPKTTVPLTPTSTPTRTPMVPVQATMTPTASVSFTCAGSVCTGPAASEFAFKTLQGLINQANAKLSKTTAAAAPLVIDGRIDMRTVNAFMPVSRAVGGTLAIFDQAATPNMVASNAIAYSLGIAKWLGLTWVEATATVPGHWERMRIGQTVPNLPKYIATATAPATAATQSTLCPRGATATSVGCVWPPGTVVAYSKRHGGKWRVAVPNSVLANLPAPASGGGHAASRITAAATKGPSGFGLYGFQGYDQSYGFGYASLAAAASHTIVAELDQAPAGVQQVDETQLDSMTGEAPAAEPAPAPAVQPAPAASAPASASTAASSAAAAASAAAPAAASTAPTVYAQETEASPTEGRYKGCIARFNKSRKVYSIYCPVGSQAAQPGLGIIDGEYFRCLFGNCGGLGATDVTPPPPDGFVKTAEVTTLPRAGETSAGDERDKFFRLKNPLMWAAIAGVAAAAGGGGYMVYRRRHRGA